ncbi:MAG: SAM-dependent methyltransferase, partial [Acidiferrobacterales bacterium]|nr:SAM-dependent methyltransferase [Acidiferrobacterales bacterium]
SLAKHICNEASASNMPFSRFMQRALYEPGLGYYSAGKHKFGEGGDFVTAPELGAAFAFCLAEQCQQVLEALPGANIFEAGAGQGRLAVDILLELERRQALPEQYLILELSQGLRTIQKETIKNHAPHLLNRVEWIDDFPSAFVGIMLGNELLDAMPVELFEVRDTGMVRMDVTCNADQLQLVPGPPLASSATQRFEDLSLPTGYRSEINLQAEAWIASAAQSLYRGVLLLIDYGFPRDEYYHPQRNAGTLMCHYRHHAHVDPLILIGLQDITAHVDFTAMAEAALDSGLDVLGYTSQGAFLMASGLEKLVTDSDAGDSRTHLQLTAQIKKLTNPSEMGELFKVIAFGKEFEEPLKGFMLQDRRHRL